MSVIITKKNKLVETLNSLIDWDDKYLQLIDLGKRLPTFDNKQKTEGNRVQGCTARTWLTGEPDRQGRLIFEGESDSQLVKGLLAILIEIYSQALPKEILADNCDLTQELQLNGNIMPVRLMGFEAMQKKIRQIAKSKVDS